MQLQEEQVYLIYSSFLFFKKWQVSEAERKISQDESLKRGKGLIAEDHDWADSSDSSDDEEDTINLGLIAFNDEADLSLMAKIEEVPEQVAESSSSSASTFENQDKCI